MDFSIKQALTVVVVLVAAVAVVGTAISMTDKNNEKTTEQNDKMWSQVNKQEHAIHNLFDASKFPTKSQGGATVTNNGDGSFTVSGSGNLSSYFGQVKKYTHEETLQMLKVGKTIKCDDNDVYPRVCAYIYYDNESKFYELVGAYGNVEATITQEMLDKPDSYLSVWIYGAKGLSIKPGTVKPILYQE